MSNNQPKADNRRRGKSRRTQSERSEEMRSRLKQAVYDLVAGGGLEALRIAKVANAARVSQGAVLHHFKNKNELTLAAIERALELANQESQVWQMTVGDPRDVLEAMVDEFRSFFFSDRFWVAIAITVEYSKNAGFSQLLNGQVAAQRQPVYSAWEERLVEAGWARSVAAKLVRSSASLVSGVAVRRMWIQPDSLSAEIIDDWIEASLRMRD